MIDKQEKQDIESEVKNHYAGINTYCEWCSECGGETPYTISDIGEDSHIESCGCHERIAPCDLCRYYNNDCGKCDPNLERAILQARNELQH